MRPLRILITAGPTIEAIDPVRYISNYSTGIMGYELARLAKKRKHRVTLISGPTNLKPPNGVRLLRIETARELERLVRKSLKKADVLVMASAVSDYRPVEFSANKIKSKGTLTLKLAKNPDILGSLPKKIRKGKIIVGFALETENLLKNAAKKMKEKGLDLIVANEVTKINTPFGSGKKSAYLLKRPGSVQNLKKVSKIHIARAILDTISELCYTSS